VYGAVDYVGRRGGNLIERYEFYCTDDTEHNMHRRVVVPCYWKGELIGSTSRTYQDGIKPKYYADYEPNYVYNMDRQVGNAKFVVVTEGPFDAMAIDGVAVLGNECSEIQADIIDSLGREVIVVPDFDSKTVKGRDTWAGSRLVDQAIEYGWSVSFPIWRDDVKDISEAVKQYGRLFTLKAILAGKQSTRLKIELHKKRIHGS
jgi:DNA primase